MAIKSRLPDDITDERAMRPFLDSLDRKFLKAAELTLPAAPTTTQIETFLRDLQAIFRER